MFKCYSLFLSAMSLSLLTFLTCHTRYWAVTVLRLDLRTKLSWAERLSL
jgi:hypothetical protein